MKLTLPSTPLIRALELTTKVSTKHVTLPVLQCVLISTSDNVVTFTTTNLEISIVVQVPGVVVTQGRVAVPAQTLLQAVQYIHQKEISLSLEETVLNIEAGTSKTKINIFPVDEFPSITKHEQAGKIIQKEHFTTGIKSVAFAASQSSIKPELGSIYIQQKREHSLTFVATDSFRLMEKTVSQKDFVLEQPVMVPQKNALEIARVCDLLTTNPELVIDDSQCALNFINEGVFITSRLVTGSFPDYEQIIPKEYSTHVTVLKNDLLNILKRTQVFLNKFQQVSIKINGSLCEVSSHNGEVGTTTDSISIQTEGDDISLNFNQQYVYDVLSHIHDDTLLLHFAGIGRPLVIKGVNESSVRYLVMPMNR
jgi:DNA polymerase-3 subunit beta